MPFRRLSTFAEDGPVLVAFYNSLVEQERREESEKKNNRIKKEGGMAKNEYKALGHGAVTDSRTAGVFGANALLPQQPRDGLMN